MTLERFVQAQTAVYATALAELKAGRKQSHWMWFVFSQIANLGHSVMSQTYALQSLQEARAYLAHPLLSTRLRECCQAVMDVQDRSAYEIFGAPDDLKFRSCLTLFAQAAPKEKLFHDLLEKYFDGEEDPFTLAKLS